MTVIYPQKKMFGIGLDLGSPGEGSALSVVEVILPPGHDNPPYPDELLQYHVRDLHRFLAGRTYTDMGQKVNDVLIEIKYTAENEADELPSGAPRRLDREGRPLPSGKRRRKVDLQIYLVVDGTVVGNPTVELIKRKVNVPVSQVVIRGQFETRSNGLYQIPKHDLTYGANALLEEGRLKIAQDLDQRRNFTEELKKYRDRPKSATPDPWREFPADDLIFATAIACWKMKHQDYCYFIKG